MNDPEHSPELGGRGALQGGLDGVEGGLEGGTETHGKLEEEEGDDRPDEEGLGVPGSI